MLTLPPIGLTKKKVLPAPALQHIESVSNGDGVPSTINLNLQNAVQSGDVLIIASGSGCGSPPNANLPPNFTQFVDIKSGLAGDGQGDLEIFYKIATGSEGTNFSVSFSGGSTGKGAILSVFRGSGLAPTNQSQIVSGGQAQQQDFPAVGTTLRDVDISYIVMFANRQGTSSIAISTPPTNYTLAAACDWNDQAGSPSISGTRDRGMVAYYALGSALAARPVTPSITWSGNAIEAHSVELEIRSQA